VGSTLGSIAGGTSDAVRRYGGMNGPLPKFALACTHQIATQSRSSWRELPARARRPGLRRPHRRNRKGGRFYENGIRFLCMEGGDREARARGSRCGREGIAVLTRGDRCP
jgi:hypothetical protein